MDQIQSAILSILNQSAVGKSNAMKSDDIFNALIKQGTQIDSGRTQEQIRQSISSMVNDHGQLIGSGGNGYYITQTRDEVNDTISDLEKRSNSISERVEALKETWNKSNPGNTI